MPEPEQQTAIFVEREGTETGRGQDGHGVPPADGEWEAYSLDVLTDLLDS